MAFWGIELKPGRPHFHKYDSSKGRLHISQATLGHGDDTNKVTVQCNVGYESPNYICSLFSENMESVQLNIELKEVKDVKFSVIGRRSVHLSGYYTHGVQHLINTNADESESSYAKDITEKKTEKSDCSNKDAFVDDSDSILSPPVSSHDIGVLNKKGKKSKPRKKYQCIESDDDNCLQQDLNMNSKTNAITIKDSEDEDEDEDGTGNFFTTTSLCKPKYLMRRSSWLSKKEKNG